MTIKTSRVDLKTLAASVAIVGALAPGAYAQATGAGQPGQLGGAGQQESYGQTGQTGQMGQTGQEQDRMGQAGQRLGTAEQEQLDRQLMGGQQQGQQHDRMGQQQQAGQEGKGTQLYVSSESIRHVQEALKENDHDIEADGRWGPETSAAIRDFQQEKDLEATGKLDFATLQALGVTEQLGFQETEAGQEQQQRDQDQNQNQQERQK